MTISKIPQVFRLVGTVFNCHKNQQLLKPEAQKSRSLLDYIGFIDFRLRQLVHNVCR